MESKTSGESNMSRPGVPAVAFACLATLLPFAQGCRTPAPSPLTQETRASLGAVGVYSVGQPPDASIAGPVGVGKQRLKGAAKGGGIGLGAGAGGGALTGAVVGLACGPFAVVCSPIFAAWGAVIGGTGGLVTGSAIGAATRGANAIPEDVAKGAQAAISTVVTGRDLQAEMRRYLVNVAGSDAAGRIDLGAGDAVDPSKAPDYGRFAERGVHGVLEIAIERLALTGKGGSDPNLSLRIDASARLISIPDNRVLWSAEQVAFESSKVQLSAWTADDSRLLRSELDRGLETLARRIGSEVFPDATVVGRPASTASENG